MRFAVIIYAFVAILTCTACANSDEDIPTSVPTATSTPSLAGDSIIFCPQIGDGSTPSTPTPEASCEPSAIDPGPDAPNVSLQQTDAPPLPSGLTALSNYFLVVGGKPGYSSMLAVDLFGNDFPGPYGWYTFENGDWRKLPNSIVPRGPRGEVVAVGEFPTLPANLIVLAETS